MNMQTADRYDEWLSAWKAEHPDKVPPTRDQFRRLVSMFYFTPQDLGLPESC